MAMSIDGDSDQETGPCSQCGKMAVRTSGPLRMGWRFNPKDEELIAYLREKNAGKLSEIEEIPDVDICKVEPEDLPGKSLIKTDDLEWFFFSPFKRKYQRGCRKDRMTNTGYWKVTGKDRNINSRSSKLIGKKRTLVFYAGRAPSYERTNWIAHEYQTIENGVDGKKCEEGAFVIYRVKKKLDADATPTINMPFHDDTQMGDAVEQFETPLNQGILESSDMPVERSAADETDGRLYHIVSGEGHCISRISAGVDGYEAEATEVGRSVNVHISAPDDLAPLNQGIPESSDMPVERSAADETDGRLYHMVSGEGHCISRISAGVDGYEAEATEVETQVQSSKNSDQPECSSPSVYESLSPLNQNMYAGMEHNPKSPLFSDNFQTGQQLVFDNDSSNWDFTRASPQFFWSCSRVVDYKLSRNRLYASTTSSNDTDSQVAASQGRENGAVATRVNGGLCSTELEEELEKRLATLQLADKIQAEASHNLEGKQKQIPSMMTVQAEERFEGIHG